ncbi:MAG: bifunctional nicotinamide-nucleotide adenylyltransferase/Nudix hydroxylase [Acidobacteria bacterium]|nr:bifunctional nicotinamide-nucleotide adenylyltransferase/Nudix hydroxylase [Acidobacteriota bacterium]
MKKYDYAVVIGRFQPLHNAHLELIRYSLGLAEKVIIVLGSARSAPDIRNPFTPAMREEIIRACLPSEDKRLVFRAVRDYPYNDHVWTAEVQNAVGELSDEDGTESPRVGIVGFFKDKSSYYLNLFPQWDFEEFYCSDKRLLNLNATEIREKYFGEDDTWRGLVPAVVAAYLDAFRETEFYPALKGEFEYLKKYRDDTRFVGVPYKPVFLTTDAVVVQSGHVLVIRRGFQPGKGLLALPGGFLADNLTLEDSALKELKEETNIKVPAQVLRGSIKASHVFDFPERSLRGRTVTFAYYIELAPDLKEGLPRVKGGDDAKKAFWLPLSALGEKEDEFFEDHIHIIRYFLGI